MAQSTNVCGARIDAQSIDQVVESVIEYATKPAAPPQYVVTANAQHVLLLQENAQFRAVYRDAFLSVPDGVPLLWAARFLGNRLPGRVNGTDLFERLAEAAAHTGLRIFLLGGRPGAANKTAQVLESRYPGLCISGTYCPPYGFETDQAESVRINQEIRAAAPDLLFVGLGSPKQEFWIYANHQKNAVPISIGIGASFEFVSGMVKRAPAWMQKAGLEWLFRLTTEPQRLWMRYLIGNPRFAWCVLRQKMGLLKGHKPDAKG
jgi:N-acetylglucosaminyldiphosphoundecaprenol N-acetyl-beta-D-mannosaminyltransferase